MREDNKVFVTAARVASELHFASLVAQQVSLTAKNASAISVRAGQQAIGFKAITGFIDELATTTMRQANRINQLAMELSKIASKRERALDACKRFDKVNRIAAGATHLDSLKTKQQRNRAELEELEHIFRSEFNQLYDQLQEARKNIRSANIIATTSKVEASNAGSFKPQLEVIADNIETYSKQISTHLRAANGMLTRIQ